MTVISTPVANKNKTYCNHHISQFFERGKLITKIVLISSFRRITKTF